MSTYTIILKDSEQISIDDWRVIHRTLIINDFTTMAEIKAWAVKYNKGIAHLEISESETTLRCFSGAV